MLELDPSSSARSFLVVDRGSQYGAHLAVFHMAHPTIAGDAGFRAAFSREGRASLLLSHPNIVRTADVVAEDRCCFWVTEFVPGRSLWSVSNAQGASLALPRELHLVILREVLLALEYAHGFVDYAGRPSPIVHRNLSPLRVLVGYDGSIKITDYAFRGATEVTFGRIEEGAVRLAYFAPERCLGGPVDHRCDLYAVGGMLWEALAGQPRQFGSSLQESLSIRLTGTDPSIDTICPDVPSGLAAISQRALAWKPLARYQTASEFRSDLDEYLLTSGIASDRGPLIEFMRRHFHEEHQALERLLELQAPDVFRGRRVGTAERSIPSMPGRSELPTISGVVPAAVPARAGAQVGRDESLAPSLADLTKHGKRKLVANSARRRLGVWAGASTIGAATALLLVSRDPSASIPSVSAPDGSVRAGSGTRAPARATIGANQQATPVESLPDADGPGTRFEESADSSARSNETVSAVERRSRRRAEASRALELQWRRRPLATRKAAAGSSAPSKRGGAAESNNPVSLEREARATGSNVPEASEFTAGVDLRAQKRLPPRDIDSEDPYSR